MIISLNQLIISLISFDYDYYLKYNLLNAIIVYWLLCPLIYTSGFIGILNAIWPASQRLVSVHSLFIHWWELRIARCRSLERKSSFEISVFSRNCGIIWKLNLDIPICRFSYDFFVVLLTRLFLLNPRVYSAVCVRVFKKKNS